MTSSIVVMVAACTLSAEGAPGTSIAVVAVAEPPGPAPALVDLAQQVRDALAARRNGVLASAEVRSGMRLGADAVSFENLDQQYKVAVSAMREGDYEASVKGLRSVVGSLERVFGVDGSFARWTRAMLRLGRAERSGGRDQEANRILERLVLTDPTVFVDPELYPPSFAAEVEKARAAASALPFRTLSVTAGNRPARVFVNGRDVGPAPARVKLRAGAYAVNAALGRNWIPPVEVDLRGKDQTVALDLSLAEILRPDLGPAMAVADAYRAEGVSAVGRQLGVNEVLVVGLESERDQQYLAAGIQDVPSAVVYRAGRLRLARTTPPPGGVPALVALLASGEASPLVELGLVSLVVDQASPKSIPSGAGPRQPGVRVLLKQGVVFRGTLISRGERMLVIKTPGGSVREIPLSEVSAIEQE